MEQTKKLIQIVDELHKRFKCLGVQYISIGQCMGKVIYICASQENIEIIKKYLLPEEMELSVFSKSTS
jgi:hypothetical protein